MSTKDNKQAVVDFYRLAAAGEIDQCFALMTDDVVWHNIGSTRFSGSFHGRDGILNDLLGPLFGALKGPIRTEVDHLIADGDFVAALTRGQAETQDGTPYNNTYCQVFRFRDGKIVEVTEYMDTDLIVRVFGQG
jgi:ketosteroid isomerase-like protein